MISSIANWEDNMSDFGGQLCTLISKDDETNEKLYLFVGFNDVDGYINYSYSFLLLDEENNPIGSYMVNRDVVSKHLPNDIKGKKIIIPIIENMTRKLLDKQLPNIIVRETAEPLDGDSLKRYENITNIMVNEYGYTLIEKTKNQYGGTKWVLSKNIDNDKNKELDEEYIINHSYTPEEIAQKVFGHINLKQLKS